MLRKKLFGALLVIVCLSNIPAANAVSCSDYIVQGRAAMFEGSLSGLRQAYQIFEDGNQDSVCDANRELTFLHAVTNTAMLLIDNDDIALDHSLGELAEDLGVTLVGDLFEELNVDVSLTTEGCYEMPPGAPNAAEVALRIQNSIIPEIDAIVAELGSIKDLSSNRFRIFFSPSETGLANTLEVDYGEVLILKGLLLALKSQLEFKQAYDFSVNPDDPEVQAAISSLSCGENPEILFNDFFDSYPTLLTVLPDGSTVLAQSKKDLITAINYYFTFITYITSEKDDQKDDLVYIDINDRYVTDIIKQKLTSLRDSLLKDTPVKYPSETVKTYRVYKNSSLIGQIVLVQNPTDLGGDDGTLTFSSGSIPTPWEVESFGGIGNEFGIELGYYSSSEWLEGWFEGNLSKDGKKVTGGTLEYWGWDDTGGWVDDTISGITMQLVSTRPAYVTLDLNPMFGRTTRYPIPVGPRDLLPQFSNDNQPIPCTFGHGLNDDATLGGLLPDMNQIDWSQAYGLDDCPSVPVFGYVKGKNVTLTINGVTFALTGGGYGEVKGDDFDEVVLHLTTTKSALTITTKAKTETSVGSIICQGPLKGITAKTTDLRGNITIGGSLDMLTLDDVADNHVITIGLSANPKAGTLMKFDQIRDLTINTKMPITMLIATEWLDEDGTPDEVNAPSVGTLTIQGNKKAGLSGNFEAALNLKNGSAVKTVISNLTVAGNLSGESVIDGNVGTISINLLGGRLEINGNTQSIKVNHPLALTTYPTGTGELEINGKAAITAGSDKIKIINGAELYSCPDGNLYPLEDLRRYDELGAWWEYQGDYCIGRDCDSVPFQIQVESPTSCPAGQECTAVTTSAAGTDISTTWYTDNEGTHQTGYVVSSDGIEFDMDLDSTVVAPEFLRMGVLYKDTGTLSGDFSMELYGYYFDGSISGTTSSTLKLAGHEEVSVPSYTGLAAKVLVSEVLKGTIYIYIEEYDITVPIKFTITMNQTWWGVPDIGIVKADTKSFGMTISGSGSVNIKEIDTLLDYGP